jgi:hypothetical protein
VYGETIWTVIINKFVKCEKRKTNEKFR